MQKIEYASRLFFTGLSFAFFGLGGIILSLTAFPAMNLVVRDPEKRARYAQDLVKRAFWLHVFFMKTFGVITLKLEGGEKLAKDTGTLVVANHPTLIDVVLLVSAMKRTQCIVKWQIWENRFMRGVVTAAGYVRNDDDPEMLLDDCADVLNAGNNLVIFPEGSRTVPGQPQKFQRGAANIAVRAKAPVRCVRIGCDPPTLMKGQKWYEIPPSRAQFTVSVGELITAKEYMGDHNTTVAARRLNAKLEELLIGGKDGRA